MDQARLRKLVREAEVFKITLGRDNEFQKESFESGLLTVAREQRFHDAVEQRDEEEILRVGRLVRTERYPQGGVSDQAIRSWRAAHKLFAEAEDGGLFVHWDRSKNCLHWGILAGPVQLSHRQPNNFGQTALVFNRKLMNGWSHKSISGVPLKAIHPKAKDIAICHPTISKIKTDFGYLRALICDSDLSPWHDKPDWTAKAQKFGWRPPVIAPKPKSALEDEAATQFLEDIKRMAATAVQTAMNANGQLVIKTVKSKDIGYTHSELVGIIAELMKQTNNSCALTGFKFRENEKNVHLKPSLDRIDSEKGYIAGNLQVVTRAANFYKSASAEADWKQKARAMEYMAAAIRLARKASKTN